LLAPPRRPSGRPPERRSSRLRFWGAALAIERRAGAGGARPGCRQTVAAGLPVGKRGGKHRVRASSARSEAHLGPGPLGRSALRCFAGGDPPSVRALCAQSEQGTADRRDRCRESPRRAGRSPEPDARSGRGETAFEEMRAIFEVKRVDQLAATVGNRNPNRVSRSREAKPPHQRGPPPVSVYSPFQAPVKQTSLILKRALCPAPANGADAPQGGAPRRKARGRSAPT
jgi:hypothetical protein